MDGQCGSSCSEARTGARQLYAYPKSVAKRSGGLVLIGGDRTHRPRFARGAECPSLVAGSRSTTA